MNRSVSRRESRSGHRPPPAWFSRADALRLLSMVALFVTVVVAVFYLQGPAFQIEEDESSQSQLQDFGLGRIEIVADSREVIVAADGPRNAGQPEPLPEILPVEAVEPEEDPTTAKFNPLKLLQTNECVEVDHGLLDLVARDNAPARTEEREAIFQLLCVAATTPPQELAKKAKFDVSFADLFRDPAAHRGALVHIRGLLRRLELNEVEDDRNPYGFARYYEGWVFPDDQPENATRIVFAELPTGLEPSDDLAEIVEIDAFFFKLLTYRTIEGKARAAPLLVGFRPSIVVVEDGILQGAVVVGGLIGAVIVGAAALWIWQSRKDRNIEAQIRPHNVPHEEPPPEFDESKT